MNKQKNNDVLDAWILDKFQKLSDKLGEWFTVDNFDISSSFMKIFLVIFFVRNIINDINLESFILIIIGIFITLVTMLIFLIMWSVVYVIGKNIKSSRNNMLNPLRNRFSFLRVILLMALIYETASTSELTQNSLLNLIEGYSLYLFLVFASLEYKKPTEKTIKEILKDLTVSEDGLPSPA
jgi:hypothetical protein